ncbi:Beta-catenin-like protein 1 [Oopsacas minuta]|uniref:Beta-catenin-like protein 1 n=1 Tax=Oopsacas minuta TaxID=111878 RepID=A0AAV7JZX4_9METZ|nr:Beta-catenin-like protein 1 [Oopsacas minuta]
MCRRSSLKVLNHALQGKEGIENCIKFIDLAGLRTIFPFFMLPNKSCKKNAISGMEQDEHVISIILSLLRNVQGQHNDRILAKFVEKDMEKSERLVELHFVYKQRSSVSDSIIYKEIQRTKNEDRLDEDAIYMKRLDGGLYVLQQIDLIVVEVLYHGSAALKDRIYKLFEQQRANIDCVKSVVIDFIQHMGEASSEADHGEFNDKRRLIEMVNVL